ncbi:alpha/beta fold hydrolase [Rhizobium wenxiniae]|uniref:alpha/beta fold hydrolase n=1 Tax=Rhizobium wenxiniae TaxID=1737357 RepID=UPI003C23DA31
MITGDVQGPRDAPAIVFVHGLRQSRLIWSRQLADPALASFRLIRFDLRGHGDSDRPNDPAAYSDLTKWGDDLRAVLDGTRTERAIVVGWSLGGLVVGGYLHRHGSDRLAGLVLADAVTKLSPGLLTPLSANFARATASPDLAERVAATSDFLLACFEQPPSGADLQQMMVVNGMTPEAVAQGLSTPTPSDFDGDFTAFEQPLLLVHGAKDRLVRQAMSERMKGLKPSAQVSIFPDAGHSPFWEDAPRFNRELAVFAGKAFRR